MYDTLAEDKKTLAATFNLHDTIDYAQIRQQYEDLAERIRPLVCDTAALLAAAMAQGKRILFEGAQGTMLDVDHGTYPFVTSSSATAGGASIGTGVPPTKIHGVIGVSKAYITRVGVGSVPHREQSMAAASYCVARATNSAPSPDVHAAADGSMCRCCAIPRWLTASTRC